MPKVVLSVDFPVAIRYVSKFGISQTMGSLTKYELICGLEHLYFSNYWEFQWISSSQLMNSIIFQRGRAQPPTSRVKSIELPRCFVIKLQHKHENAHKCQESAEAMKIHGGWCFLVVSWGPKLQSNDMWLYYAWTIKWLGIYMAISIFLYIYHDLYWLIMIMLLEMILRLYWKKITNWG